MGLQSRQKLVSLGPIFAIDAPSPTGSWAPALVTDALVRGEQGQGRQPNTAFLDPVLAMQEFITPALAGLGDKVGALVFQLSPLPFSHLQRLPLLLERLRALLRALPDVRGATPDGVVAVEVRDPEWLSPAIAPQLAAVLKETGAVSASSAASGSAAVGFGLVGGGAAGAPNRSSCMFCSGSGSLSRRLSCAALKRRAYGFHQLPVHPVEGSAFFKNRRQLLPQLAAHHPLALVE